MDGGQLRIAGVSACSPGEAQSEVRFLGRGFNFDKLMRAGWNASASGNGQNLGDIFTGGLSTGGSHGKFTDEELQAAYCRCEREESEILGELIILLPIGAQAANGCARPGLRSTYGEVTRSYVVAGSHRHARSYALRRASVRSCGAADGAVFGWLAATCFSPQNRSNKVPAWDSSSVTLLTLYADPFDSDNIIVSYLRQLQDGMSHCLTIVVLQFFAAA